MTQKMPTRDELIRKLQCLCTRQESRDAIAVWAMSIIDDDSMVITDELAWDILKRLGAADLPATDREFLYTVVDFEDWRSELLDSKR